MTAEENFQFYFPGKEIPAHALQKVILFDDKLIDIDHSTTLIRPVSLACIIGTNYHPPFGMQAFRWVDVLLGMEKTQSQSMFRADDINTILDMPLDNVELIQFYKTNEFYIYRGSDQRIALHKLTGKDFVQVKVTKAIFKPLKSEPDYWKNAVSGIIPEALKWIKTKLFKQL